MTASGRKGNEMTGMIIKTLVAILATAGFFFADALGIKLSEPTVFSLGVLAGWQASDPGKMIAKVKAKSAVPVLLLLPWLSGCAALNQMSVERVNEHSAHVRAVVEGICAQFPDEPKCDEAKVKAEIAEGLAEKLWKIYGEAMDAYGDVKELGKKQ